MTSYSCIVVGTDGSETSLNAVDRAAAIARDSGATLVITCAYLPADDKSVARAQDVLGDEAYQVVGSAPAEDTLRTGADRAKASGATGIETRAVQGRPGDTLKSVVKDVGADLLVVGNVGLNTLAGRILGSVPLDVVRHAGIDVLVVHTS
ncbi:MAG: universal stress protein [Jatrophihabitantaceae bacterium]